LTRIARFSESGRARGGVVVGQEIADAGDLDLLVASREERARIAADAPRFPLEAVRLEAPVARPGKILAVGLNYRDHAEEVGIELPKVPMIFNKQSTSIAGPFEPIHLPRVSDKLDYEGELACVIGRRCRHVPVERAGEVIAGYSVCNDVSVRDWQMRVPTFTMGKSFDTHCPLGPWIVTGDEIDPHALDIRTWVNGELRQSSNTSHLIFDCFALVAHLTEAFTLEPGDVISTGTPSGVGSGMKPRRYLKCGDVVRIEIEGIGAIENRVVAEPETALL
jgi:2-keto-4-pentenoate hydratase/2-oxohepta-3-ene-1,7-dioic acid hydratase in catechol pathway